MFTFAWKIESPLPKKAEDKNFLWYHLSLPRARPRGIGVDPQAVSGFPVLAYCYFSKVAPKGIPYRGFTAFHRPAALWRNEWVCTGFHHCVVFIYLLQFITFCFLSQCKMQEKYRFLTHSVILDKQSNRSAHRTDLLHNYSGFFSNLMG